LWNCKELTRRRYQIVFLVLKKVKFSNNFCHFVLGTRSLWIHRTNHFSQRFSWNSIISNCIGLLKNFLHRIRTIQRRMLFHNICSNESILDPWKKKFHLLDRTSRRLII
jgi:hypothetical protein